MRIRGRCFLLIASLLLINPGFTSENVTTGSPGGGPDGGGQKKIIMYLLRLGQYFGYNLDTDPKEQKKTISEELLTVTSNLIIKKQQFQQAFEEFVGAIPAVLVNPPGGKDLGNVLVPSNNPYGGINKLANKAFSNYGAVSATGVSVSDQIDQPTTQDDPVSQAVLNILGTPNASYCFGADHASLKECFYPPKTLNNTDVTNRVIGAKIGTKGGNEGAKLPAANEFFSFTYNQPLIAQLNSNSLLGPLMYDMEQKSSTSSGTPGENAQDQLTAKNQAQEAANFIRYATSAVTPLSLADYQDYDALYVQAGDQNASPFDRFKAQSILSTYLASLRIYAAQSSVAVSNLYEMLAKRMPQKTQQQGQEGQANQESTVALEEFKMATWRLHNPEKAQGQEGSNPNWTDQLNTASPATVQKEMAILLAEINYQLYLSRQQQERILLTNSLMLLLNLQNAQPNIRALLAKAKS